MTEFVYLVKTTTNSRYGYDIAYAYFSQKAKHRGIVKAFSNKANAVAYCSGLNDREILPPRGISPFHNLLSYEYDEITDKLTSNFLLEDLLEELKNITGVAPEGKADDYEIGLEWYDWWFKIEKSLSEEQRKRVWEIVDLPKVFEVKAMKVR